VAPVLAGFATLFFLPDRPAQAKWLPAEERDWLMAELEREHKGKQGHGHWAWVHHLGMVLLLTAVYFGLNFSSYGLSMFMPKIIEAQLTGSISNRVASLLASLPYAMAFLGMLINGRHSDHTGERIWHVAVPLFLVSLSMWLATAVNGWLAVLVMILGVGAFMYAHLPAFWPIPTIFLGATAAASAIGFINMIGNLGGFFGPMVVGKYASAEVSQGNVASFSHALRIIACGPLLSAVIILILGFIRRRSLAAARLGSCREPK
ncbi:MAG TPA: MFS transporter, partial [Gemmataceae bacterium]|nr:MFS transporter [Gemmataceae bacterium]